MSERLAFNYYYGEVDKFKESEICLIGFVVSKDCAVLAHECSPCDNTGHSQNSATSKSCSFLCFTPDALPAGSLAAGFGGFLFVFLKKAFITNSVEVHKKTNLNRTEVIFKFLKCR